MKKSYICAFLAFSLAFTATACGEQKELPGQDEGGVTPPGSEETQETLHYATIAPTVYDNEEVVDVEETEAGSIDAWQGQVVTPYGNNDNPTKNALINSPWHTLVVNGTDVPVYSTRCGEGTHSFAWIDVVDYQDDFVLDVELSVTGAFAQCVVLPLSAEVTPAAQNGKVSALIKDYGSFTFTFTTDPEAVATDPTYMPLTVMVTKEEKLKIPVGYDYVEIEPGYHENYELEFTEKEMYYIFKPGLHEISSINVPEGSVLWLERGAYLKCADRMNDNGTQNSETAIHMSDCSNAQVRGRGLLDMGEVLGGDYKYKHVFGANRCVNPVVDGLTIINANTWTMCFYNCENALAEHNLLLGFRTYSDGIMMSECRNSAGRYNFVRTGDDAIEFKGTGWGGANIGENCVFEYNACWTDKGSGYCLTWESACDMTNMTFRHNSVGFAQPVWAKGNNVLDCRMGTDIETRWGDVTFRDIEIYHVISPNVITTSMNGGGGILDNILFDNITVHSTEPGVFAYSLFQYSEGSITNIRIKNMNFCGKILTAADLDDATVTRFEGGNRQEVAII